MRPLFQPRPVNIVDAGIRKDLDLLVVNPVEQFGALPEKTVWPSIYRRLADLTAELTVQPMTPCQLREPQRRNETATFREPQIEEVTRPFCNRLFRVRPAAQRFIEHERRLYLFANVRETLDIVDRAYAAAGLRPG